LASGKSLEIRAVSGSVYPDPDPYQNVTDPELWFSRCTYTGLPDKYSSLPTVAVEEHRVQHAADVPQVNRTPLVFSLSVLYRPLKIHFKQISQGFRQRSTPEVIYRKYLIKKNWIYFFNASTCLYFWVIEFLLLPGLLRGDVMFVMLWALISSSEGIYCLSINITKGLEIF
jgi:hypothetical protein